ncbi:hypothetical protein WA026_015274 [Henosepilachna vigintioctopunctata]|uniref:Uncharacterized protein n=1 Tax=Henosepilachna vigintioctopunctata TaxID=420089 RepID=A0AAW1TTT6_9CUCU
MAKIRLESATEIVSNLQTIIDYQKTIIEMKNVNMSHSSRLSVGEAGCDVADVNNISQQSTSAIRSKLESQQDARTNRQSGGVSTNYASVLDTGTKKVKKGSVFGSAKSNAESPTMFLERTGLHGSTWGELLWKHLKRLS